MLHSEVAALHELSLITIGAVVTGIVVTISSWDYAIISLLISTITIVILKLLSMDVAFLSYYHYYYFVTVYSCSFILHNITKGKKQSQAILAVALSNNALCWSTQLQNTSFLIPTP